jgi:predicted dehydrogenase
MTLQHLPSRPRVLVIGTGSIGRRHIGNLLELGAEVWTYSYRGVGTLPPPLRERARPVEHWQAALQGDVDAVVVANSTAQHMDVALEAARAGKHLFVEKPLSVSLRGVDALMSVVRERGVVVEAGFMLRCHPNLQWIRRCLASGDLGEVMHLRAAVGQWLPDWRPGTDHRLGYGAFRASGGGVIFDLIHELDIVHWLIGPAVDVTAMTRVVDCLEIETEGVAQIGLQTSSGALAQVHLDYVRPGYGRDMEIVCRHGVIRWDYLAGTVQIERSVGTVELADRVPEGFERNTMFRNHMHHFLRRLADPSLKAVSSLEDAIQVLRVALASHRASAERRHVRPSELHDTD